MDLGYCYINGEEITLNFGELAVLKDHYFKVAQHHKENHDSYRHALYMGKYELLIDILKKFDEEE